MQKSKATSDAQPQLGGLGTGAVVVLDGGTRVRLDDRVDYWPATGEWRPLGPPSNAAELAGGVGMTSLLEYLASERVRTGHPVLGPVPLTSDRRVTCNYCQQPAELHGGLAVYPDRKDLANRSFWVCWNCNAWVGCHNGTDQPFGGLANEELRHARISAHKSFDPLWEQGRMTRREAYAWLSKTLSIPSEDCHIGMLSLEDCRRVNQVVWDTFEQP
ncbi:zinc-finger-containing protein [Rhizobacter sp. LjRoot28]|uniref:zinc-finger-containing protein n=1 Tax=Rhizobacter sp. LjRoot28 TaxID=3342309 RepID=UPI003ED0A314